MADDKKKNLEEEAKLEKKIKSELLAKLDIQQESYNLSNNLLDDLKEVMGITSRRTTEEGNLLKINKEMNKAILNQKQGLSSVDSINKQILSNKKLIGKADLQQQVLAKKIGDTGKENINNIIEIKTITSDLQKEIQKEYKLYEETGKLNEQAIINAENKISLNDEAIDTLLVLSSEEEMQLLLSRMQTEELKKQQIQREKDLITAQKLKDSLGVAGGFTKLLGSIPGLGGFASDALGKVTKEMEKAADETGKIPTRLQSMGKILKETGKGLIKNLTDPMVIGVALIGQFVKALKATDKEAGEMAKHFGISYQHALHHSKEANHMALTYGDIMVSNRDIEQAQVKINKHFGTAVHFSETMAANFASIQKRTGHSDETMGFFAKSSMAAGKEVKDILLDTHKVVLEQNSQNKMSLNVKDVQEGIAKTSKSIQLTSKLNTKELANAVIEAKKLGISLSEVEGIANHILDFESSIQSELEAELLLGKDINLEKARQLALEGDMAGVAEEVLKNKAIMNAFDTKNVIAQDAAAKALGMNREQLAGMVMEQKNLAILQEKMGDGVESMSDAQGKYSKLREDGVSAEAAALLIGDESLANQLESVSQAEKFEATLARVQEVFVAMATPVLSMVDGIVDMAGGAERLANMLKVIGTIWVGIKGAQLISLAYAKLQTKEDQKQLAFKTGSAAAFAIANPFIALAGIVVAAGIAGVIASQMKDGMIDSKGGMVVSGPKGSIQLDKNDSIIAGTDLGGGGNTNPENNKMAQEQLQESKTQNQLLSQLIGNTNKLKQLDNVGFYEVQ